MKVNEYLSAKRAAGEILEKKYKRASKKFPIATAIFCVLIAGMFFGATRIPKAPAENISPDSFAEYERSSLGNAVTNTLNNGIIADNGIGYTEDTAEGIKVVSSSGECLLPPDASNINITDKGAFFRDNSSISYCFMKYGESYKDDTNDKEPDTTGQIILGEPCGNCIITNNDTLYLIRFSKDSHVYSYDLNGKNEKEVISEPVRSFAVLENAIFYLDYNNSLVKLDREGNKIDSLDNVDKFYLNGDLFVQNNDRIIRLNLNNENGVVVTEGIDDLLGVINDSIYYMKDSKVFEADTDGRGEKVISQGKVFYDGVYINNGNVIAVGEDL